MKKLFSEFHDSPKSSKNNDTMNKLILDRRRRSSTMVFDVVKKRKFSNIKKFSATIKQGRSRKIVC